MTTWVYKLRIPTVGFSNHDGKQKTVIVPADAVLEVSQDNLDDGTVEVVWNDQRLEMFMIDLRQRGQIIDNASRTKRTRE